MPATSLRVCAHAHVGVLARQERAADKNAEPVRFVVATKRLLLQETTAGPSGHDEGVQVVQRRDRWQVVCCRVKAMCQHDAVCCMSATKWISRRSSAVPSRKRSGRERTACMAIVST